MTTAVLERASWHAHLNLREFPASAERDAMHLLHPRRAALVDLSRRRGWPIPPLLVPHISGDDMIACGLDPTSERDYEHNLLCNAGINRLESLLIAGGGQAYDNTHTAIGVGDGAGSVPTAAATDTDLAAVVNAANRYWQMMDATFPSAATQVVTFQATFATGNANFTWNEWGLDQHTASGATASTAPMLNHRGIALGSKTSASALTLKVTVQIS